MVYPKNADFNTQEDQRHLNNNPDIFNSISCLDPKTTIFISAGLLKHLLVHCTSDTDLDPKNNHKIFE